MRLITACLLGLLSANVCAEGCIVRANGKKICLDDTPPEQRAANDASCGLGDASGNWCRLRQTRSGCSLLVMRQKEVKTRISCTAANVTE